jgi:tungstate transport system permease protein
VIRDGIVDAWNLLVSFDASVVQAAVTSLTVSVLAVALASFVGIGLALVLARRKFPGQRCIVVLIRVGMSVPTVLIGLLCFGVFSRRGILGESELLFTPAAIVVGEFFLAVPIIATLTHGAFTRLDPRVSETAQVLGAGIWRRAATYLSEARLAVVLAVLTAFSRCFTELGIAMMVGGNFAGRTRTLTTATAMETSRGEFARGIAMCLILLTIALLITLATSICTSSKQAETT